MIRIEKIGLTAQENIAVFGEIHVRFGSTMEPRKVILYFSKKDLSFFGMDTSFLISLENDSYWWEPEEEISLLKELKIPKRIAINNNSNFRETITWSPKTNCWIFSSYWVKHWSWPEQANDQYQFGLITIN